MAISGTERREVTQALSTKPSRNDVLEAWFTEHYSSLTALAHLMLGVRSEAEEVVMDTFAKATFRWRLFREVDSPDSYLRRVVMNECRSRLRRRKVETRVKALMRPTSDRRSDAEIHATRLEVWDAILSLPERQRACVALRYLDDYAEAQIAEVLGIPLGTVKSQLSRARSKLVQVLGEVPDGDR